MSQSVQHSLGTVASLWRYPVKSMLGEEIGVADVSERGVLGDRRYALMDVATGKVASAKHPRKWAGLFACRAGYVEPPQTGAPLPPVRIVLGAGDAITSAAADCDAALSRALERSVTLISTPPARARYEVFWPDVDGLVPMGRPAPDMPDETLTALPLGLASPPGTFFDSAVIHLVTTASLNRLQDLHPGGEFDVRRFRPNIVVDSRADECGFVENAWIGRTLRLGEDVRLRVLFPCPRCVMATLAQDGLAKDPGILRAAQHNRVEVGKFGAMGCVGVYAEVLRGGTLRPQMAVELE